jgi:hypothetical protein
VWRKIRIAVLLLILVLVAGRTLLDQYRTTSWKHAVSVGVFPLNADGSVAATATIQALTQTELQPIADFLAREAQRFGVKLSAPVTVRVFGSPASLPPQLARGAGVVARLSWSLRTRWYCWRVINALPRSAPAIALFLLYHDPATSALLPHSSGMQRGLMGIVHVYAGRDATAENNIVTAHELLHTFGATDKYAPASNAPLYPDGYADPLQSPRFPQTRAEIMAGRMAVSDSEQVMAANFDEVVVGPRTAREIGWSAAR